MQKRRQVWGASLTSQRSWRTRGHESAPDRLTTAPLPSCCGTHCRAQYILVDFKTGYWEQTVAAHACDIVTNSHQPTIQLKTIDHFSHHILAWHSAVPFIGVFLSLLETYWMATLYTGQSDQLGWTWTVSAGEPDSLPPFCQSQVAPI